VYFKSKEIVIKPFLDSCKYFQVSLCKKGKCRSIGVSSLVATAFLNRKPDRTQKVVIDHISNDRLDNRLSNLQLITPRENTSKDRKNKTSKYTGVCWCKNKRKWLSTINIGKTHINLGIFEDEDEAYYFYQNALKSINNNKEIVIKRKSGLLKTNKYIQNEKN
jgi:hypothetical protein